MQIRIVALDEIIVTMMEEKSDIFLAGGDALVYLTGPVYKKYSTTFVWSHPNVSMRILGPVFQSPPCKHMYAFRLTVTAVGLFQKLF